MSASDDDTMETDPWGVAPSELDPFGPERIAEDRIFYRQFVYEGAHFFASNTHSDNSAHIYRINNITHDGDVFSLEPCAKLTSETETPSLPVEDTHFISNICELAGALELGELIRLPNGVLKTVGDASMFSAGEFALHLPDTTEDPDALLKTLDPPSGPQNRDITKLLSIADSITNSATLYLPPSAVSAPDSDAPSHIVDRRNDIKTDYIPVQRFSKWTFNDSTIRDWVESKFTPGDRVLNACAGKTHLTPPIGGEIIRNDGNPDRNADIHVDVAELAAHFDKDSFDVIVFDPPWSLYQSNLRYESYHVTKKDAHTVVDLSDLPFDTPSGEEKSQLGHARLAKENFDWLLKSEGTVVQLTFHGTTMPARLEYDRLERVIFDPIGEGKAVIGSVDQNTGATTGDLYNTDQTTDQRTTVQQNITEFR